jgi:hypothetical protein
VTSSSIEIDIKIFVEVIFVGKISSSSTLFQEYMCTPGSNLFFVGAQAWRQWHFQLNVTLSPKEIGA